MKRFLVQSPCSIVRFDNLQTLLPSKRLALRPGARPDCSRLLVERMSWTVLRLQNGAQMRLHLDDMPIARFDAEQDIAISIDGLGEALLDSENPSSRADAA
jgi:hypothetical protein